MKIKVKPYEAGMTLQDMFGITVDEYNSILVKAFDADDTWNVATIPHQVAALAQTRKGQKVLLVLLSSMIMEDLAEEMFQQLSNDDDAAVIAKYNTMFH